MDILADIIVLLHLFFILFVCGGGLLALRIQWIPWLHIPAALWGIAVEFFGLYCPLTFLENWFRTSSGQEGYSGDFIERYLVPVIYPAGLTRAGQVLLGSVVVLLNVAIYLFVWRRSVSRIESGQK